MFSLVWVFLSFSFRLIYLVPLNSRTKIYVYFTCLHTIWNFVIIQICPCKKKKPAEMYRNLFYVITNYLFLKPQNAYNRLAHLFIITEGHEIIHVYVFLFIYLSE